MNITQVVRARSALGAILSGYNIPGEMLTTISEAHDALLAYERQHPKEQAAAIQQLAGPRADWEIG